MDSVDDTKTTPPKDLERFSKFFLKKWSLDGKKTPTVTREHLARHAIMVSPDGYLQSRGACIELQLAQACCQRAQATKRADRRCQTNTCPRRQTAEVSTQYLFLGGCDKGSRKHVPQVWVRSPQGCGVEGVSVQTF